jgi:hypothetical protein
MTRHLSTDPTPTETTMIAPAFDAAVMAADRGRNGTGSALAKGCAP